VSNISLLKRVSNKTSQKVLFLKRVSAHQDVAGAPPENVSDVDGMSEMLTQFFSDLFCDSDGCQTPPWIYGSWDMHALQGLPPLDCHLVRVAIQELRRKKSCASDHLVAEMLQELDDDVLTVLADMFKQRLLNVGPCSEDTAWDENAVQLLKKKGFAHRVRDFRPITVLPVLFKVYSRVILALTQNRLDDLKAPQFAFRAHFQTHEVVFILRNLVEKAIEWDIPVFILDGDLLKAYDYTRHTSVIEGLRAKGVEDILTAAWIREICRARSVFKLGEDVSSTPVARTRSLIQGDPSAPAVFNATLDVPASEFCAVAAEKGWGYRLDDGSFIALLLFADNFWLVSTSPAELARMTEVWLDILKRHGWSVPLGEATWCSTGPDDMRNWHVELPWGSVRRASRKEGFNVLGTIITFDASFEVELRNRISRAWRAFYSHSVLLCCRTAPLKDRLRLLTLLVVSSLFWCSGSWNLTSRQVSKLRGVQLKMLQKIVGCRPEPLETHEAFMERWNSKVKRIKVLHGFVDWDRHYFRSMFAWGGHIARLAGYDGNRITHRVLNHKSWQWIQRVSSNSKGSQLHGRKVKVFRWERVFYQHFPKHCWQQEAQDKYNWTKRIDEMVERRTRAGLFVISKGMSSTIVGSLTARCYIAPYSNSKQ